MKARFRGRLIAGIVLTLLGLALLGALALYWGGWIEPGTVPENELSGGASLGLDRINEGATDEMREGRRHA